MLLSWIVCSQPADQRNSYDLSGNDARGSPTHRDYLQVGEESHETLTMNELLWVVAAVGKRWLLSGWSHVWASQVIEIIAICLDGAIALQNRQIFPHSRKLCQT